MDELGSDLKNHVVLPLHLFNAMAEVYYAAKRDELVPRRSQQLAPEPEVAERVGEQVDLKGMELRVGHGIPGAGYVPKGVAAPPPPAEE